VTAASPTAPAASAEGRLRPPDQTRRLTRRAAPTAIALVFVVVALGAFALPGRRPLSFEAVAVAILCYALAARVQFEFGPGYAVPTEGVFVAMWFLLPPRLLPVAVCAALLAGALPDILRGRVRFERLILYGVSSWHAVGPAVVLYLLGPRGPRWSDAPWYAAALASQFALDFVANLLYTRRTFGLSLRDYLRTVGPAYAVDTLLAPLGLLVAFPAYHHPWALLLLLPVLVMFSTFAKERRYRLDNAVELSNAYRGTAMLLGDVIEADDEYTGSHSRDVVDLVLAVADRLGLDADERRQAEFAALLHDVGKVKVPAEIINKPGPLDDAEWEVMKKHTILGEQMLEKIGGLLGDVGHVVRSCHERWDGTGYPDALAGDDIPLSARIVCACDAWSAMTTDRTYRKALSHDTAAAELRACSGTHFDPQVVDALVAVLSL
jgi:putative nucleotidyltransferase with HDIG domain